MPSFRLVASIAVLSLLACHLPAQALPKKKHRPDDVVLIHTIQDLQNIQNDPSGNYRLANDIDGKGFRFIPIGIAPGFVGSLDGAGYAIRNLNIQISTHCQNGGEHCYGLFGYLGTTGLITNVRVYGKVTATSSGGAILAAIAAINDGTIKQVSFVGTVTATAGDNKSELDVGGLVAHNFGSIVGSNSAVNLLAIGAAGSSVIVGGIVAWSQPGSGSGLISSSFASGSIVTSGYCCNVVGGLVGYTRSQVTDSAFWGTVSESSRFANCSAPSLVGGLVGYFDGPQGAIQRSSSDAQVQTSSMCARAGGLVGWSAYGQITETYASGSVSGDGSAYIGGLIGEIYNDALNVTQSYSTVAIVGGNTGFTGGLIGLNMSSNIQSSYWDLNSSGIDDPSKGCGNISSCSGVEGLTTSQFQNGQLPQGFDPSIWEPMLTNAVNPSAAYYPQLWSLAFPVASFPLAGLSPYGGPNTNPKGAKIITLFDHSLRTSSDSGLNGKALKAALYSQSCDDTVLVFSGQIGLSQFGQDTATCADAGYEQDGSGDQFLIGGANYVGDSSDNKNGHTATQFLNYEGHPGIDYGAKFTPVFAAVSGIIFYPYQATGTGQGKTGYDTYCRFHTLAEIPDYASAYRVYYLHLKTHPNGLGLAGFVPDPPCLKNKFNTPGQLIPISPVSGCYTLNAQPFIPTALPLPPGVHANAGCQIAVSGDAGVSGSPHLHFEIQQIVPAEALSASTKKVLSYFPCWNENNNYQSKTKSLYCLSTDPYGWTASTPCGDVSQWPPNGNLITDEWACLKGIPSRRYWMQ